MADQGAHDDPFDIPELKPLGMPRPVAAPVDPVAAILTQAAAIRAERAEAYGGAAVASAAATGTLFPKGVFLLTDDDHRRFFLLRMVMAKLARYAVNFNTRGHEDSLKDAIVYLAMLQALDKGGAGDDLPF